MPTPRYVVKKIGDTYLTQRVPAEPAEKALYLFGGAALTVYGMFRGGLTGTAAALTGAGMLYYVATNTNPLAYLTTLHKDRAPTGDPKSAPSYQHDWRSAKAPQQPADKIDEQSMESFPASDAPAHATPST